MVAAFNWVSPLFQRAMVMTTVLKDIIKIVSNFIETTVNDPEITDYINQAVREVESLKHWGVLSGILDMTPDSSGILQVPPRSRLITDISLVPSGGPAAAKFYPREDLPTADEARLINYWYIPYPSLDVDGTTNAITVTQGSSSVTQAGGALTFFDADDVGSNLTLTGSSFEYEITAFTSGSPDTITLAPVVSSSNQTSINAIIDISGRERIILYDASINVYTDQVRVYYQKKHPILYTDSSRLLIPCPRTVAYIAIQLMLQTDKYDVDAQRLEIMLARAKNEEIGSSNFAKTRQTRNDTLFSVRSRRNIMGRRY